MILQHVGQRIISIGGPQIVTPRGAAFLPFSDSFNRADGALGAPWTGATWTIASNKAVNTPTEGADLLAALNGNFADWTGDNPDDWTVVNESGDDREISEAATGESHASTPTPGGGMCNLYTSDGTNIYLRQSILTIGAWYKVTINIDTVTAGGISVGKSDSSYYPTYTTTGNKVFTTRVAHAYFYILRESTADVTFDDVTCKPLTLPTLFSSLAGVGQSDVIATVKITLTTGTQAGLVVNLDSAGSPANFVIAYHDGTDCKLDKCVAGIYTSVISAAATYAAGGIVEVRKGGTSYSLYYQGAQVGTTQTISDAGIINNTLHGIFSTYSGNSLDDFTLQAN